MDFINNSFKTEQSILFASPFMIIQLIAFDNFFIDGRFKVCLNDFYSVLVVLVYNYTWLHHIDEFKNIKYL